MTDNQARVAAARIAQAAQETLMTISQHNATQSMAVRIFQHAIELDRLTQNAIGFVSTPYLNVHEVMDDLEHLKETCMLLVLMHDKYVPQL